MKISDKKIEKCVTNSANIYKACSMPLIGGQSMNEVKHQRNTRENQQHDMTTKKYAYDPSMNVCTKHTNKKKKNMEYE